MAIINSILGKMTGKIGSIVLSNSSGSVIAREYNPNVSNPNTTKQVDQRAKLKLMSQIAAALAPVIVIPKEGLKSSRNLFIKKNFKSVDAESGVAQVTYENLQITAGNAAIPAIHVLRSQQAGVQVYLEDRCDAAISRVVYILYKKTTEQTLQYMQSVIAENATAEGNFPASMLYIEGDIVVFAYGMKDLNGKATAKYSDYNVQSGLDIAELTMSRQMSLKDYQFTQTRGTTLFAGESESVEVPEGYSRVFVTALGPGSVSGAGVFANDTEVTVVAIPDSGKFFRGWKLNGTNSYVSQDASYTFTLNGQTDLVAVFADTDAPRQVTCTVVNGDPSKGSVQPEGELTADAGETIHLVATPSGMNSFSNWSIDGVSIGSQREMDYIVNSDVTIVANWSAGFDQG